MRTPLVVAVLLFSAPLVAEEAAPKKQTPVGRKVRFNGRLLGGPELATLEQLERGGPRVKDGEYWYDARTGAAGTWGGPHAAARPSRARGASGEGGIRTRERGIPRYAISSRAP